MYQAYEIIKEEEIKDINSRGVLLRHKKTGAHVALLINDDKNKVFDIAFRTPPKDSTGVAHIIEHTVLCGSDKYPLKDPFVELAKGSLNTFLNAMTYPDKTMYPVASCNDRDFQNLMGVYLDAVFHPNIYKTDKIFKQEGWHYHMESEDAPLTYNGVVYNEMKGVFSSADSILERTVFNALFPDTPYGVESGGDPDFIPDLTYEQYLDFHRSYYHPSNSFIYLYGDMDMEEKLDWMDREYLSKFEPRSIDSSISYQKPFDGKKELHAEYPVLDNEPLENNTYLNMSMVTGDGLDILTSTAFHVLEYVLLDAPGAPVKQALLDAGIGKDVSGTYEDGILQPFFSIDAKYANASDKDRFEQVITETLEKVVREGVNEKSLQAAIHSFEFRFREADYASYPKGLIYILDAYDSWLYDENKPFEYLKMLPVYEQLKEKIGTGYYEKLIEERLLNNPHRVLLTMEPKRGLAEEREKKLAEHLASYKASLSTEEQERIVRETKELQEYQEEEDSLEAVETLPHLEISDIDKETPIRICREEKHIGDIPVLHHTYDTRGISYLTMLFSAEHIPGDLLPYMSLLKSVLGLVSTEHYSYADLSSEINARTGGIACGLQVFPQPDGSSRKFFGVRAKYLDPECAFAVSMMEEILFTSVLEDEKRLYEIVASQKAQYQETIPAAGHQSALSRAAAQISEMNGWQEVTGGIAYYRFLEDLFANFEERKADLIEKLRKLEKMIFRRENLMISLTAQESGYEALASCAGAFADRLFTEPAETGSYVWEKAQLREGIQTSGQVQYVASVGNFREAGYAYTGAMRILKVILNYEYLWMNLRVKGGAYGCMSGFQKTGTCYLLSYRDPHLKNTLEVYSALADYVQSFEADERTMTKYIVGTVSELDTPLNAKAQGDVSLSTYFTGLTEADFQKERDQILQAGPADIRSLSAMLKDSLKEEHVCVVGSEASIRRHEDLFDHIEALVQG